MAIIIIFLLQMTKLMHRKVKQLFEGHTESSYSLPKGRKTGWSRINALSAPTVQIEGFSKYRQRHLDLKEGEKRSTKHGNGFFFLCTASKALLQIMISPCLFCF